MKLGGGGAESVGEGMSKGMGRRQILNSKRFCFVAIEHNRDEYEVGTLFFFLRNEAGWFSPFRKIILLVEWFKKAKKRWCMWVKAACGTLIRAIKGSEKSLETQDGKQEQKH